MRLVMLFLALALLFLIPFVLWGDSLQATFAGEGAREWLEARGGWAWAAGLILLVSDVLLPIPSTAVLAALGYVYGAALGGAIGSIGSMLSAVVAYLACRLIGQRAARWLVGERDLQRGEKLFRSVGGWLVALSRWLPLLPEVVACMAGLARMPWISFLVAVACGSVPMAFTFAAVGELGSDRPVLAIVLSAALPLLIWPAARRWLLRRRAAELR